MKPYHPLRSLLAGSLLGLWIAAPASAAILTYQFDFVASDGVNAGSAFTGTYAFNDALLPISTVGSVSNYALDSFNFVYAGETFTAADDPAASVFFDPAFTNLLGISYLATINGVDVSFSQGFLDVSEQDFFSAVTGDSASPAAGNGPITTSGPTVVPEPGTWLASLLALGVLMAVRRIPASSRAGGAAIRRTRGNRSDPISRCGLPIVV